MLARFPYGGSERTEIVDWCASAQLWAQREERVEKLLMWHINDTPITMCRNRAIRTAIDQEIDFLIMLDSDMAPDIDRSKPFLPTAFDFAVGRYHESPTIVAAPYCTAAPDRCPTMGRWRTDRDGYPIKADLFTREEVIPLTGIGPAPFLGTGLMLIDMRIFTGFGGKKLSPPWFDYEWTDAERHTKASTEDMFFSRNASMLFAQIGREVNFVAWDCWSYHVKQEFVGKPVDMTPLHLHNILNPYVNDETIEPMIATAEPTDGQRYVAGLHERLRGFNGA
jgi:hypothetical protein